LRTTWQVKVRLFAGAVAVVPDAVELAALGTATATQAATTTRIRLMQRQRSTRSPFGGDRAHRAITPEGSRSQRFPSGFAGSTDHLDDLKCSTMNVPRRHDAPASPGRHRGPTPCLGSTAGAAPATRDSRATSLESLRHAGTRDDRQIEGEPDSNGIRCDGDPFRLLLGREGAPRRPRRERAVNLCIGSRRSGRKSRLDVATHSSREGSRILRWPTSWSPACGAPPASPSRVGDEL
jgi:hypothetical protein